MTGIVTSTYRYKRPPRKRKPVRLEVPAIVRRGTKPETPPAPANDDRKPAIVTVSGHGPAAVADGSVDRHLDLPLQAPTQEAEAGPAGGAGDRTERHEARDATGASQR